MTVSAHWPFFPHFDRQLSHGITVGVSYQPLHYAPSIEHLYVSFLFHSGDRAPHYQYSFVASVALRVSTTFVPSIKKKKKRKKKKQGEGPAPVGNSATAWPSIPTVRGIGQPREAGNRRVWDADQGRETEVGNEGNEEIRVHRRAWSSRVGGTKVLIWRTKKRKE